MFQLAFTRMCNNWVSNKKQCKRQLRVRYPRRPLHELPFMCPLFASPLCRMWSDRKGYRALLRCHCFQPLVLLPLHNNLRGRETCWWLKHSKKSAPNVRATLMHAPVRKARSYVTVTHQVQVSDLCPFNSWVPDANSAPESWDSPDPPKEKSTKTSINPKLQTWQKNESETFRSWTRFRDEQICVWLAKIHTECNIWMQNVLLLFVWAPWIRSCCIVCQIARDGTKRQILLTGWYFIHASVKADMEALIWRHNGFPL